MNRPFRFGVLVSNAGSLAEWQEVARKAEGLGYATLLVAAAAATSTLRVGTFVLDNDFRHPAAMAKEAATVDVLTGGRLELGIGAGWNPADYHKTGMPFEPAGVRVSKLEEALRILKAFFEDGSSVTFKGRYYQVTGLDAVPQPVQRPRPPILLGAAGRRMLTLAAREADILNFPDRPSRGVSTAGNPGLGITFEEQMAIVREAAGARYEQLELSSLVIPRITERVSETIKGLAEQMQTTPRIVADMPGTLVGSIDAIVEKLQATRERFDISYAVVPGAAIDDFAPVVARLVGT